MIGAFFVTRFRPSGRFVVPAGSPQVRVGRESRFGRERRRVARRGKAFRRWTAARIVWNAKGVWGDDGMPSGVHQDA